MFIYRIAAVAILTVVLGACAQTTAPPVAQVHEKDLQEVKELLRAGNGFTCTGRPGSPVFGCSCDKNAGPESPFNCNGLEELCKAMGQPYTCNERWWDEHCGCGFVVARS